MKPIIWGLIFFGIILVIGITLAFVYRNSETVRNVVTIDEVDELNPYSRNSEITSKEYNESKKEVVIKNASGDKETLAKVQLTSDIHKKVHFGTDVLVAELDVSFAPKKDNNLFDNITLKDLKNGNKEITKDVVYKYPVIETKKVPNYVYKCKSVMNKTGQTHEECDYEEEGTKDENITTWKELNSIKDLPSGTTRIGMFTDVAENEYVEWIPNLLGQEIKEWADWEDTVRNYTIVINSSTQAAGGNYISWRCAAGNVYTPTNPTGYYSTSTGSIWIRKTTHDNRFIIHSVNGTITAATGGTESQYSIYDGNYYVGAVVELQSIRNITTLSLKMLKIGLATNFTVMIIDTNSTNDPNVSNSRVYYRGYYDGATLTTNTAGAWYNITMTENTSLTWPGGGAPADTLYPSFSNYWDTNSTLIESGTGLFNVTLLNTNGTVLLEINNTNITASNFTANVYNVSYNFLSANNYTYRWHSWGNGSSHFYNNSGVKEYTVNVSESLNITACRNLTTANAVYSIQNNLQSPGTCIWIKASNITLNGYGKNIDFSQADNGVTLTAGIDVLGVNNTQIKNITINTSKGALDGDSSLGIWIDSTTNKVHGYNTYVRDFTVTNVSVGLDVEGINNTLENCIVNNVSMYDLVSYNSTGTTFNNITSLGDNQIEKISLLDADNTTIIKYITEGNNIVYNSLGSTTGNVLIKDSILNGEIILGAGINFTLINTTYTSETVPAGDLYRYWYAWINVTNNSLNPIPNAVINISNVSNINHVTNLISGATGITSRITLLAYKNLSGTTIKQYPFNATASRGGYVQNSTAFNLVGNNLITISMGKISGLVYTYIDGLRASKTIYLGVNNTNVSGRLVTGVGQVKLYVNNVLWNLGNGPLYNLSNFSLGSYIINTTYDGYENASYDDENWTLTVTLAPAPSNATISSCYTLFSGTKCPVGVYPCNPKVNFINPTQTLCP